MAGIDSSIYFQQKPLDIFGSLNQGLAMRDSMDQRAQKQADLLRAQQERDSQAAVAKAYQSSFVQNPDGTMSLDLSLAGKNLSMLTGNTQAGLAMKDLGSQMYTQKTAAEKVAADKVQQDFDNNVKTKQLANQEKELAAKIAEAHAKNAAEKEIKPNQATAAGFGRRLEQAEQVFADLSENKNYNRADAGSALNAMLPNFMKTENGQRQEQAERNYINAVLRRESGAAISPSEFESAELQYFPRQGDSPEVIAQKKANRQQAGITLQAEAGRAWDKIPLQGKPSDPILPKPGKVVDGYRFKGGEASDQSNWEKI